MLNKENLINDLRILHKEIVNVYRGNFDYKKVNDPNFSELIKEEYKKSGISKSSEKKEWDIQYLNRSAYTLLNKILFIRICEDKGFMLNEEDKVLGFDINSKVGQKLSMIGLQKWSNLISNYSLSELIKFAFKDMSKSYNNIPLYKEDKYDWLIPSKSEVENAFKGMDSSGFYKDFENLLRNIIITLDTSRYNFGESSDNVLGDVYEKFLDKDTRKALGQFYTPDFVIRNILNSTVSNVDVLENPFIKVLDPSCGSGHFLIMAYDVLRDKFEQNLESLQEKYQEDRYKITINGEVIELSGTDYWSEKYLHYHLLKHCIYGADIDGFALQITTINLLLKDLDNFIIDELNIIECDSLVYWEKHYNIEYLKEQLYSEQTLFITLDNGKEISYYEAEELLKKCNFWNQKFDYVIGNPPYIPITKMNPAMKKYYKDNYRYSEGRINTFALFFERVIKKCSYLGFIVPSRILLNTQYSKIREYILNQSSVKRIYDLSEGIFQDATVDTVIFILDMVNISKNNEIIVERLIGDKKEIKEVEQDIFLKFDNSYLNIYINKEEIKLIRKVIEKSVKLGDIADIRDGIIQGAVGDELFIGDKIDGIKNYKKVLYGKNINKYSLEWDDEYINYDKDLLTELENERTKGRGRGLRLREPDVFERPKILTRQTADRIIGALDEGDNYYYMNTLHGTYVMDPQYDIYYVLGVLNSNLIHFYYTKYNYEVGKTFAQVKIENLNNIPIPKVGGKLQEEISGRVKRILKFNERINNYKNHFNPIKIKGDLMDTFIQFSKEIDIISVEMEKLQKEIDYILFDSLELEGEEVEIMFEKNKQKEAIFYNAYRHFKPNDRKKIIEDEISQLKHGTNINSFKDVLKQKKYLISNIADEYNVDSEAMLRFKQSITEKLPDSEIIKFYDLSPVYTFLYKKINKITMDLFISKESYFSLYVLEDFVSSRIDNLDQIMDLLRDDNPTLSFATILEQGIDLNSESLKTYIKKVSNNKELHDFIKYENKIYGISLWGSEIHKKFYIDTINYHTSKSDEAYEGTVFEGVNKTKSKAETALKSLQGLDFADKQDYLEILTDKIKKAFD